MSLTKKSGVKFDPLRYHKAVLKGTTNFGGKGQLLTIFWSSLAVTALFLVGIFVSSIPCLTADPACSKPELVGNDLIWVTGYLFGYLPVAWSFMTYIVHLGRDRHGRLGFGL